MQEEIRNLSRASGCDNTSTSDVEKFLRDILESLAVTAPLFPGDEDEDEYFDFTDEDEGEYCDFTAELMYDPVKCSDGRTYDRFSVFQYNKHSPKKLIICCDDVEVRGQIFEKFAHKQPDKIMRSRRSQYRSEAIAIADEDDFGEALERLDNVLQWDPCDFECLRERNRMRDMYREQALRLPLENGNNDEVVEMLQVVQKWSPFDKEIFDKFDMISRQHSGTSQTDLPQTQLPTHKIRDLV